MKRYHRSTLVRRSIRSSGRIHLNTSIAYSPQLGERLHINYTTLNIVGIAGNIGVWGTSPLAGRMIDLQGPRLVLLYASMSLLIGYMGILYIFNNGGHTALVTVALIFCSFITGK